MDSIDFVLHSPPFSINNAYYKRSFTRTAANREWAKKIMLQLAHPRIQRELNKLRDSFDPRLHGIELVLSFRRPKQKMFTNAGLISNRSMDLSNIEKLLIDQIFVKKYSNREYDDLTIRNLEIDDKFIIKLTSSKCASPDNTDSISVTITVVPNQQC